MYIRRKVFSLLEDELGEQRYFSTNEIILEGYEDEYVERTFTTKAEMKALKPVYEKAKASGMTTESFKDWAKSNGFLINHLDDADAEIQAIKNAGDREYKALVEKSKNKKASAEDRKAAKEAVKELQNAAKEANKRTKGKGSVNVSSPSMGSNAIKGKERAGEILSKVGSHLKANKKTYLIGGGATAAATAAGIGVHAYRKNRD